MEKEALEIIKNIIPRMVIHIEKYYNDDDEEIDEGYNFIIQDGDDCLWYHINKEEFNILKEAGIEEI